MGEEECGWRWGNGSKVREIRWSVASERYECLGNAISQLPCTTAGYFSTAFLVSGSLLSVLTALRDVWILCSLQMR